MNGNGNGNGRNRTQKLAALFEPVTLATLQLCWDRFDRTLVPNLAEEVTLRGWELKLQLCKNLNTPLLWNVKKNPQARKVKVKPQPAATTQQRHNDFTQHNKLQARKKKLQKYSQNGGKMILVTFSFVVSVVRNRVMYFSIEFWLCCLCWFACWFCCLWLLGCFCCHFHSYTVSCWHNFDSSVSTVERHFAIAKLRCVQGLRTWSVEPSYSCPNTLKCQIIRLVATLQSITEPRSFWTSTQDTKWDEELKPKQTLK